jgi:hypothetical protein
MHWEWYNARAARFTLGDYRTTSSVTNMLQELNWITMQERRKRAKVIMLYRIIHLALAIPYQYLIPRGASSSARGYDHRFQVPFSRLQCHQQSFFPSTIRLWNNIPAAAVQASTIVAFKGCLPLGGTYSNFLIVNKTVWLLMEAVSRRACSNTAIMHQRRYAVKWKKEKKNVEINLPKNL